MKATIIVKNAIRCKHCGDIIESTYRHDFKFCSCKRCAVDGGLDYLRRCGTIDDWEDLSEYKEVEVIVKYKVGNIVSFKDSFFGEPKTGVIQVVDTFPNSTAVHYDILDEQEPRLYKHISERDIVGFVK